MRKVLKTILSAGALLLSLSTAQSQDAKLQPHYPKEILKFEIKFEGADADKIKTVHLYFNCQDAHPAPDQSGFTNNFGGTGTFKLVSPGTFEVEEGIPGSLLPGNYNLRVDARADAGGANYDGVATIRIGNRETFTPPKITVKER